MTKIFDRPDDKQFDIVFNCGGETRFSQEDEVYRARSYNLSLAVGHEAARRKVSCFVECSTGQVYKPAQAPRKESDKLKPWSTQAKWKLSAEEDLSKIDGLNLCILRLANVYGPYTTGFLSTALCMARVYKYLEKDMKWLWDKDLMTNTVHVDDAVRALWRVTEWYRDSGKVGKTADKEGSAPIFNIVDHGKTCMYSPRTPQRAHHQKVPKKHL